MDYPYACNNCPVWKLSLFRDFEEDSISWLAENKTICTFNKDEYLFIQGEEVSGIYCHLDGLAKVVQTDSAGKIGFTRLVLPGDTSGHRSLFIESTYKGTTNVISKQLNACHIPKENILYLLSTNASFAKNLVTKIASELQRTEEDTFSIKEKTVRNRLAHLIVRLCDEYADQIDDGKILIRSEITKRDIASLLMVANETIIRLMSEMKMEGLLTYEKKRMLVLDYEKLRVLAKHA